jgi:predicted DNA-binding WGR domain protein
MKTTIIELEFRCTEGSSNKYWIGSVIREATSSIARTGKYIFSSKYGRIGTSGQITEHQCGTVFGAFSELQTKIKEKLAKGYIAMEIASRVTDWNDHFEMDLKAAFNRFMLKVSPMIPFTIAGATAFSKAGATRLSPASTSTSPSPPVTYTKERSIKEILEERRKNAAVTI